MYFYEPYVGRITYLTPSFLLYIPVFAALVGGQVPLYRPLQAAAGGKVFHRPLKSTAPVGVIKLVITTRWSHCSEQ
jgi:hypothetical protein